MHAPPAGGSLADFLSTHADEILHSWDEFASTVPSGGATLDAQALRDHAAEILSTIARDMDSTQSDAQQRAKSRGNGAEPAHSADTAAQTHADTRISSGFAILPMMTEYRALRASVLHLWARARPGPGSDEVIQITRFNEAIDQALIESAARYTQRTKQNTDLFIGVLGHDIRNPLATIAMSVHVLSRSGRLDQAAARPILNSVARLATWPNTRRTSPRRCRSRTRRFPCSWSAQAATSQAAGTRDASASCCRTCWATPSATATARSPSRSASKATRPP